MEEAKEMRVEWVEGGVKLGDAVFTICPFTADEFGQWMYALDRANSIFDTLAQARERFERGQVDYTAACMRLRTLLDEIDKAALALTGAAKEIARFFGNPIGLKNALSAMSPEGLQDFVKSSIPALQASLSGKKPEASGMKLEK
jgi:hypothetical protein